ncbi:AAA family ATPase [Leptolyngbyaceae cyanobacterium UHCC 1019]
MSEVMSQGIEEFKAQNYAEAIESFTTIIKTESEPSEAYSWRAWSYYQQEEYTQTILDCTESINLNSSDFAYWVRGKAYEGLGELQAAIADFTTSIVLSPSDATSYFPRAFVWEKLGRFDQAIADYTTTLELDPGNTHALGFRAFAYQEFSMDAEALTDLLQLRDIEPERDGLDEQIQAIQDRLGDRYQSVPAESTNSEAVETLESLLTKLDQLTGLPNVKAEVKKLVNLVRVQQLRRERGLATPPLSMHLVFTGNPGTGKTTVARLISRIYKALGLLSKGHLVEVDRSGLVAGFVGQTALKVTDVVTKAKGGILFIDEAYTLVAASGSNGDFGQEAIDTLLKSMEDYRDDFVVIVAGYPEQMTAFLTSNPGLKSRFNKYVAFEDYTINELCEILDNLCISSGYFMNESATYYSVELMHDLVNRCPTTFGNARGVRNLFEQVISAQASRVIELEDPSEIDLCTLDAADFIATPLVLAAS